MIVAHPRTPRDRPRSIPRRQAPTAARRRIRRIHKLSRVHKNTREYTQSYVRSSGQYVRVLDAESVEGDEADSEPVGGIWRCIEGGEEILDVAEIGNWGELWVRTLLLVDRRVERMALASCSYDHFGNTIEVSWLCVFLPY